MPSIFGTFLLEKLYYNEKLETRTFFISVIIIGFCSYFLLYIVNNIIEIIKNGLNNYNATDIHFFKALIGKEESIKLSEVFYSTIIGIIIGILSAKIINKGEFYRFFREKIHITNSTGQDVWGELFDNSTKGLNSFVYVIDKENDRVYGGWVQNYSKDSREPELLITNADIRKNSERKKVLYKADKVYLKINKEKMIIEIKNKGEKENEKSK